MPIENKKAPVNQPSRAKPAAGRVPSYMAPVEEKLKIPLSPDFLFFCNPARWDVFADPTNKGKFQLLPMLSRLRLIPGVSGIDRSSTGEPAAIHRAVSAREARGDILVRRPFPTKAFGEEVGDYLQVFDGFYGPTYFDAWTRPYLVGRRVEYRHDRVGRLEFYAAVRDQILGDPDVSVIDSLKATLREQLRHRTGNMGAGARIFAEEAAAKLAFLEAMDVSG